MQKLGAWKPMREELQEWLRFVQSETHVLKEYPQLLFQQAANQPDAMAPATAAERRWENGSEKRGWVRWINKPQQRSACIATLVGHSGSVRACAYSPDGRGIASGAEDGTLKVWDAQSGSEMGTLTGHSDLVLGCAYSPDGSRIVSVSKDNTVRVWDVDSGATVLVLRGFIYGVYSPV